MTHNLFEGVLLEAAVFCKIFLQKVVGLLFKHPWKGQSESFAHVGIPVSINERVQCRVEEYHVIFDVVYDGLKVVQEVSTGSKPCLDGIN